MKQILKNKKMLISSIGSMIVAIIMMTAASFAWFSMNKETASNGMQLKVEASPNLIIDDTATGDDGIINVSGPSDANISVTFSSSAIALKLATHDGAVGGANWTYSTGLKSVTNLNDVSIANGTATTPVYAGAVNSTSPTKNFYIDFPVYIASTGTELDIASLTAEFGECTIGGSTTANDTLKAASIDFYAGNGDITASSSTYKGTINVAGLTYSSNAEGTYNASATTTSVTLQTGGSVPYNQAATGVKYITVIMRCYFDGALSKQSGKTFITSASVDVSDVVLSVKFTANPAS